MDRGALQALVHGLTKSQTWQVTGHRNTSGTGYYHESLNLVANLVSLRQLGSSCQFSGKHSL